MHQLMGEGKLPEGNVTARQRPEEGLTDLP